MKLFHVKVRFSLRMANGMYAEALQRLQHDSAFTLKMANVKRAETTEQLQHTTWHICLEVPTGICDEASKSYIIKKM
jgi:hypothetical protein